MYMDTKTLNLFYSYLSLNASPYCCGLTELGRFMTYSRDQYATEEAVDAYAARVIEKVQKGASEYSLVIATLNDDQLSYGLDKVLNKAGFKEIVSQKNKNSGQVVHLFSRGRELTPKGACKPW